ncbi:MAG TPA: ABC transporter permease [Candidatus Stercoripulliclostridium merdipullorum]|uniref:ABC transporter permease n=1 Tax=Candidatus Stercoripulliclostridium merdipullorum TaxID=2840952 RepID=A0A9D1NBF2_9FIRM|nr:ABC transporter permease [Candidatus Stercoripulliclostridium merdipullorum]
MKKKLRSITYKFVIPAAFIGLFFVVWELICLSGTVAALILPTPGDTFRAFFAQGDMIMHHTGITLLEAVAGLAAGVAVGFVLAVLMDACKVFDFGFKPLLVITQTVPTIVIAPLISLWLGYDIQPKILLVALTTFFPIAIGLSDGYRSTDPDMIDLMRSMGAGKLKIFWFLKLPSALPNFFSALKISTTYAIVGAVVSEWVGALGGLGYYILRLQRMYAYDAMFATILWVIVLSLVLLFALEVVKRCVIRWDKKEN